MVSLSTLNCFRQVLRTVLNLPLFGIPEVTPRVLLQPLVFGRGLSLNSDIVSGTGRDGVVHAVLSRAGLLTHDIHQQSLPATSWQAKLSGISGGGSGEGERCCQGG